MTFTEILPLLMFVALALFLFSGFPVAFVLGGVGLSFAFIALLVDPWLFDWPQFNAIPARVHGAISTNLIPHRHPHVYLYGDDVGEIRCCARPS